MRINKEQISRISNEVMNGMVNDFKKQLNHLLTNSGMSLAECANLLQTNEHMLRDILYNTPLFTSIPLSVFVRLMVATQNAISVTPMKPFSAPTSARRPKRGIMPPPPFGRAPWMNEEGITPLNSESPRPWERPNVNEQITNDNEMDARTCDLHTMPRQALVDMVMRNGWQREIDLRSASRSALISFLRSKENAQDSQNFNNVAPSRPLFDINDFDEMGCMQNCDMPCAPREEMLAERDMQDTQLDEREEAADFAEKLTQIIMENPQLKEKLAPFVR